MSIVPKLRPVCSTELLGQVRARRAKAGAGQCWGLHVQREAVTLVNGPTSVGKTTWLHRLGHHLAAGTEFLGITPPRPFKVLYVDFESHDGVLEDHLSAIGSHPNLHYIVFGAEDPVRGSDFIAALSETIREGQYEVVIADSLTDAYPVNDERDNSEANKQMLAFRDIARRHKVALVLVHNVGQRIEGMTLEAQATTPFLGRGGTARADRADVVLNFLKVSDTQRLVSVPKSRQSNKGMRIYFRFAGELGYVLDTPSATKPTKSAAGSRAQQVVTFAEHELVAGRDEVSRKAIGEHLGLTDSDADKKALTRVLRQATKLGLYPSGRRGFYTFRAPFQDEEDLQVPEEVGAA